MKLKASCNITLNGETHLIERYKSGEYRLLECFVVKAMKRANDTVKPSEVSKIIKQYPVVIKMIKQRLQPSLSQRIWNFVCGKGWV